MLNGYLGSHIPIPTKLLAESVGMPEWEPGQCASTHESAKVHPALVCGDCGDTRLTDDTCNGNPGWWRCHCGILHAPQELPEELQAIVDHELVKAPEATGELVEGFTPHRHL